MPEVTRSALMLAVEDMSLVGLISLYVVLYVGDLLLEEDVKCK